MGSRVLPHRPRSLIFRLLLLPLRLSGRPQPAAMADNSTNSTDSSGTPDLSDILPPYLNLPPHLSAHKYFFVCTLTVAAWDTLVLSPRTWRLLRTKEWPPLKILFHFLRLFMPVEFTIVGEWLFCAYVAFQFSCLPSLSQGVAFFDTKWSQDVSVPFSAQSAPGTASRRIGMPTPKYAGQNGARILSTEDAKPLYFSASHGRAPSCRSSRPFDGCASISLSDCAGPLLSFVLRGLSQLPSPGPAEASCRQTGTRCRPTDQEAQGRADVVGGTALLSEHNHEAYRSGRSDWNLEA